MTTQHTTVLYIPGLGDSYDSFRRTALKAWSRPRFQATLVPSIWYNGADLATKLAVISRAIDQVPLSHRIVLIGESAGATLALHTASQNTRVSRVITLCGVAQRQTPIALYLRNKAPALDEGVRTLPDTTMHDVHSVRARVDTVVGKKYSIATGAVEHVIASSGHLLTIALCLTIYSKRLKAIAKD